MAGIPIKVHYNPSTGKVGFNPVTKKVLVTPDLSDASVWCLKDAGDHAIVMWKYDTGGHAYCLANDSNDNVLVGSTSSAVLDDVFSLTPAGVKNWSAAVRWMKGGTYEYTADIIADSNDNVIAIGAWEDSVDYHCIDKWSSAGVHDSDFPAGGDGSEPGTYGVTCVRLDGSDNIYVGIGYGVGGGVHVIMVDSDGSEQWRSEVNGLCGPPGAMVMDSTDSYLFVVLSQGLGPSGQGAIYKLDVSDGSEDASQMSMGGLSDVVRDGTDIYTVGYSHDVWPDVDDVGLWNESLVLQWSVDANETSGVVKCALDGSGDLWVVGIRDTTVGEEASVWLIDGADGSEDARYDSGGIVYKVVVDSSGDAIVLTIDTVMKINSSGVLQWAYYIGSGWLRDIIIDSTGQIIVCGNRIT